MPYLYHGTVLPEWIDHNGHMNLAYYVLAFDLATGTLFDAFGLNQAYRDRTGCSTFSGSIHVTYKSELHQGEAFTVKTTLLGYDDKRIRYMNEMVRAEDGAEVAILEGLSLHVDLSVRRVSPMRAPLPDGLARIQAEQGTQIKIPAEIGQTITKPPIYAMNG